MTYEYPHGEYVISTDPTRLDFDLIQRWMSEESYWAKGRTRQTVETAAANSLNFGAYEPGGSMVGGARVVTDYATFAWLCDVFVVDAHRGEGLGVAIVAAVCEHPRLRQVKRFVLATVDAHDLYRRFGFETLENPDRFMMKSGSTA